MGRSHPAGWALRQRRAHRLAAGLIPAVLLAAQLARATEPTGPHSRVVAPGQEDLLADMLGRGATLPGSCAFAGGGADGAAITARYRCPEGEVIVELRPAGPTPDTVTHTDKFAIVPAAGPAPPRLLEALQSRIRSRESSFQWSEPTHAPPSEQQLADTPIDEFTGYFVLASLAAILLIAFWRERGRREAESLAVRVCRRSLTSIVWIGAVALLGEGAYRAILFFDTPRPTAGTDFEIYGVGESTLVGEPFDPKISVPRMLQHAFGGEIAGRRILVRNLAERGVPLYPQAVAFERAMTARAPGVPGIVLIMSGHNESLPPQSPGALRRSVPSVIAEQSAIVRDVLLALRRRRLLSRERTLAAYEFYLRRVLDTATKNGLTPILATMASNISRIEPNADRADGEALDAIIQHGLRLETQGQYAEARDLYVAHLSQTERAAPSLYYRAGRCEEALGHFAQASEHYWNAVDRDSRTMFGRATRPQNELVRRLAREYGVPLVDAVEIFEAHAPHGIPGADLFMDGQHPTIEGYLLLADAYAEILSRRFHTPIAHPLRDAREVAAALGFEAGDLPAAIVDAGSWLIATSVGHPFPRDRMALAEERFTSLLGRGDDFSAWVGIALSQAASRGGLLRNPADVRTFGPWLGYARSYRAVPASELPPLVGRLPALGVDESVVDHIRQSTDRT